MTMSVATAPPDSGYQKKLFYKINEVSRITGLKPYVLRYWETEFPQLAPEKDENDQRRYRQKDIDLVMTIKRLLYEEKFTIAGAKLQIANEGAPAKPARVEKERPRARSSRAATRRPGPISRAISELSAIRGELQDLLAYLG